MKKTARILDKTKAGFDAEYWAGKTPEERLIALEKLRHQHTFVNGVRKRLQRVYRIIERPQS